jgi:Restriction endonuclease
LSKTRTGSNRTVVAKWLRDQLPKKCYNCGATKDLQYHHIVPVSCGGNEVPSNVAVLCSDCHSKVHYGREGIINHGECIRRGQSAAKERGVKLGRKPRRDREQYLRKIAEESTQFNIDSTTTEGEIMAELGIRAVCYNKYKRMLLAAMSADVWPYEWSKPTQVRAHPIYEQKLKRMRGDK